jgi:altronate hydrolase
MTTVPPKRLVIEMHPKDNVLVALTHLAAGQIVDYRDEQYTILEPIQSKHKFYTANFSAGARIYMYGVLVGTTQCDVARGSLVTTANLKHAAEPYAYRETNFSWEKFVSR